MGAVVLGSSLDLGWEVGGCLWFGLAGCTFGRRKWFRKTTACLGGEVYQNTVEPQADGGVPGGVVLSQKVVGICDKSFHWRGVF